MGEHTPRMGDDRFWSTLDDALSLGLGDMEDTADMLEAILSRRPPSEIAGFATTFRRHERRAYRWDLWAAGHILNGGCDEECFRFFRWYLIGLGRERFEAALHDPDSLTFLADQRFHQFAYDGESLGYAAAEAYEKTAGTRLPDLPALPRAPDGRPWDDAQLHLILPAVAAAVGWIES